MNAKEVIECLRYRFASPEWAFATELALVPGNSSRRADAVAMNCWPSGKFGCAFFGFEIKVSRSDFLHELKQPQKRLETYCGVDALFLAVPSGLVDDKEVPNDMGIITCTKNGGARIKRMPDPCVLPGKTCEKRDPEHGYMVRHLDKMPEISRTLAVAFIRSFDPSRINRDAVIDSAVAKRDLQDEKYKNKSMKRQAKDLLDSILPFISMP